jgi:hypothetical protein
MSNSICRNYVKQFAYNENFKQYSEIQAQNKMVENESMKRLKFRKDGRK